MALVPYLGIAVALGGMLASQALGEVVTVSYRESPDSFTWELQWDRARPEQASEVLPPREPAGTTELWRPLLRLSPLRGDAKRVRFAFQARHTSRVHETDTPEGVAYSGVFLLPTQGESTREWSRLDRRPQHHLSSPKDSVDTFDVYVRSDTAGDGTRIERLILQGAHGTTAKKPRKSANASKRRS